MQNQASLNLNSAVESTTRAYCTDSSGFFADFLSHRMGDTPSIKNQRKSLKNQHISPSRDDSTAEFRLKWRLFAIIRSCTKHLIERDRVMASTPPVLPTTDALKSIMSFIQDEETAKYFASQFKKIAENPKLMKKLNPEEQKVVRAMVDNVDYYAECFEFARKTKNQSWDGLEKDTNEFKLLQANLSKKIAESIKGTIPSIILDFAISEKGEFIRGYSTNRPLDPQQDANTVNAMDTLFNAWLAEHDIISKEGVLYYAEEGNVPTVSEGSGLSISG